eukprot:1972423-Prymnesium_polylepis.1
MQPEAHSFVGYSLNCLWATGSIVRQRLAVKGWSAGLVTPPTCAAEQDIDATAADCLWILVGRSTWKLCGH